MTIRPYLPPARATVRRVTRRGRPPTAAAAARLSEAAAIVAAEPGITGAELARRLGGIDPSYAARILADVRATVPDLPPAPPVVGGPGKVVRLRAATLARLAETTGRPVGEDVDGQIVAVLDRVKA